MPTDSSFHCDTLAIIGLGLIGGSIARAAHERGLAAAIHAYDRNPLALQYATEQGFIAESSPSAAACVSNADLVVLATPPSVLGESFREISAALKAGAVVMDVASVKTSAMEQIIPHLPQGVHYVPAHPIAGSENSGVAASNAGLFAGRKAILTPADIADEAIPRAAAFWQGLGATVEYMPADLHDRIYAYVSHLPQLLAFAYRDTLEKVGLPENVTLKNQNFVRLCRSDMRLWEDIFSQNQVFLEEAQARFIAILTHVHDELKEGGLQHQQTDPTSPLSSADVYATLLPRILASCLIVNILGVERETGIPFHKFAGQGFIDFTSPAEKDPDKHLESISNSADLVAEAISSMLETLSDWIVIKN